MENKSLIERYIAHMEFAMRSDRTIDNYRRYIRKFDEWIRTKYGISCDNEEGIKQITGAMLEEYQLDVRESGCEPATENLKTISVNTFFKWAERVGIIDKNPGTAFVRVKVIPKEQPHLEWKQVEQLMQTYRSREQNRDMCILAIGFTMGLRASGIANLTIGDYNDGKLTYTNKGGARKTAYVPEFVRPLIAKYISEERSMAEADAPLFVSHSGKKMCRQDISEMCRKAGAQIGVKMSAHAMRRSALTRASEIQGLEMAQTIAAHSSSRTTQRYIYQSAENMKAVYSQMNPLDFSSDEGSDEE